MSQSPQDRQKAQMDLVALLPILLAASRTPENSRHIDKQLQDAPHAVDQIMRDDVPTWLHVSFRQREDGFLVAELAMDPNDPETRAVLLGSLGVDEL